MVTHESDRVTALHMASSALPALLMLVAVALLAGSLFGWDPLWRLGDINMSEQAAVKNRAEVLELLQRGEDPNTARVVRADLLKNNPITVTPLEAAIATRETWLVQFMIDNGALVTDQNRQRLVCVARDVGAPDVEKMLSQGKAVDCTGVETPWS